MTPALAKPFREHLREGLAAALRVDPDALESARPPTVLGAIVRKLVLRAAEGRSDAIRLLVCLLDTAEKPPRNKTETSRSADSLSQGILEPAAGWGWSGECGWEGPAREDAEKTAAPDPGPEDPLRWQKMYDRFVRCAEADREEAARKARLMAGTAPPDVSVAANSAGPVFPDAGNSAGKTFAPGVFAPRIAGKEV